METQIPHLESTTKLFFTVLRIRNRLLFQEDVRILCLRHVPADSCLASSVVVLFAGLLGPHGVLGDGGQRRSRHAGRLHDLDVLAGETSHQLLARRAAGEEEVVGHAGQYCPDHRTEPVNLEEEEGRTSPSHHLFVF